MDLITSSYAAHTRFESFLGFVRREWKAVAVCSAGFALLLGGTILWLDPAFFYPRLQTDPLNYVLKAKALVETGTTNARWAVNTPPFPYAAMPGILRAPALLLFHDFDTQLRAMQLLNIPILVALALLAAYVFSWSQPASRHRAIIVFSFAFILLSPVWIANVLLPLADAPYAAFSLAALVLARSILCSPEPLRQRVPAIVAFALVFSIAFALRFTAPAILVFAFILARGRWAEYSIPRKTAIRLAAVAIVAVAVLVVINREAIFGRYLREPLYFIIRGDKPGMLVNLLGVVLPSQIIPNFASGLVHPPIQNVRETFFWRTPIDTAWTLFGILISLVIIAGAWRSRARFLPEIVYVLVPLPVLAAVLPSATRYLMTYEPFLWIFFFTGLGWASERLGIAQAIMRNRLALASIAVFIAAGAIGLRAWRTVGTASESNLAVSVSQMPRYVANVSGTFRALRNYLEQLPRESTLLIGDRGTAGRWTAISGLSYYRPDTNLVRVAASKQVYVLAECGMAEHCVGFDFYKGTVRKRVSEFGDFTFDSVFAVDSPRAKVQVYRLYPAAGGNGVTARQH